jgi:hypothetical protein
MPKIVIAPTNVASFPEGGGHFWVYMQYVQGLRDLGCDVYWLEQFHSSGNRNQDQTTLTTFFERMEHYELDGKVILYTRKPSPHNGRNQFDYINMPTAATQKIFKQADLLINFNYSIDATMLARFSKTALVDIDPGLLQFWISVGQLTVARHDIYFTIGETVGASSALFSDCGLTWHHIRPPVYLASWPYSFDPDSERFSTISSWWGGAGKGEFVTDGRQLIYENNKRVTFLTFAALPRMTDQPLELALNLGDGDAEDESGFDGDARLKKNPDLHYVTDYQSDEHDRKTLLANGWYIRQAKEVAGCPESYRTYIQQSRGEFSCVKPSCLKFENAWISDRTLCYLASGKPAVVQHTGHSAYLPDGVGMFRFSTLENAVQALTTINANYEKHCRAARDIAETYFDSRQVLARLLNMAV